MTDELDKIIEDLFPDGENDEDYDENLDEETVAEKHPEVDVSRLEKEIEELKAKVRSSEEREEVESIKKIVTEFLASASDVEKDLAEVFLAGVTTRRQAEKAIDKIKARAAKVNAILGDDEKESEDSDKGFVKAPVSGGVVPPEKDPIEEVKSGKVTIQSFMETWNKVDGAMF